MTLSEQWERWWRETVLHVFWRPFTSTLNSCATRVSSGYTTFYVSSGRSRIDFVATHPSVQFSGIFVSFTAGRRLQLIPAAGPRDRMTLTMDLVTNGMRHCPDPTRGKWDHEKIEEMLSDPVARLTFFKELQTQIRNSSIVDLAVTEGTAGDAWENLVQITAGNSWAPLTPQGAARPALPLALERRRLLLELGAARRLTGTPGDQSPVEKAKTEITRVEKQMRRFSRWLLRRRRAMWLEELQEGIRKQDAFTVYRYARLLSGTGIGSKHRRCGQIRAHTPSQLEWAQGLAKEGRTEGRSCSAPIHLDRLQTRASGASGPWRWRNDSDSSGRGSSRLGLHTETTSPCSSSSLMPSLVHTRTIVLASHVADFLAQKKRYDELGYKPPSGSQLTETRYAIIACMESTRRSESAPVVSSRSMEWVIPKPGKVRFESCRLLHGMCAFRKAWHRGLFSGGNLARITVVLLWIPTSTSERVSSQWLHTWHWQHAVDTRA